MYNRLLKVAGTVRDGQSGILPFVMELHRELKIWKFGVFLLFCVIIFMVYTSRFGGARFDNLGGSNNHITTHQIKYLDNDVIAKINIDYEIVDDEKRDEMFEEILKSERIKGLFVVINSGGGTPNASEVLYNYLRTLRERYPVFVFIKEIGASGAYMAAMGGSKILAMPTSLVGSIGIKFGSGRFDFSEVLKQHNVGYESYTSSKYKVAGDIFKKIDDTEKEYLADVISQGYSIFKRIVAEEREFNKNDLERVANAKIFYGERALEYGLIDFLKTQDEALAMLKAEVKVENIKFQTIAPEPEEIRDIYSGLLQSFTGFLSSFKSPRIMASTHL